MPGFKYNINYYLYMLDFEVVYHEYNIHSMLDNQAFSVESLIWKFIDKYFFVQFRMGK